MQKIVFSSDQLPAHLDDRARFSLFRDIFTAQFGACDMGYDGGKPFAARWDLAAFGSIAVSRFAATLHRYARNAQHVAADPRGDFLIGFDRSQSPATLLQSDRELALAPGQLALFSNAEPAEARARAEMALVGLTVPRARLLERVANAEDLTLAHIDMSSSVAQYLARYLEFLLQPQGIGSDPGLLAHIEDTLLDLVVLTIGASDEQGEIARMRGLRAARLREVLAQIKARFSDPAFSPQDIARKLGVSPRYVQDLLQETGLNLTARVLELRLQQARAMLADPRYDRLRVADIAHRCGFGEIPYFNRAFRRRFGATPTQFRGSNGGAE